MTLPSGISVKNLNIVCKLNKSLYGLKQASRKWYDKLTYVLIQHHYTQANSDHSLLIKKVGTSYTILLVYVDDIILVGDSLEEFQSIKFILDTLF